jgi:hypothetical protein
MLSSLYCSPPASEQALTGKRQHNMNYRCFGGAGGDCTNCGRRRGSARQLRISGVLAAALALALGACASGNSREAAPSETATAPTGIPPAPPTTSSRESTTFRFVRPPVVVYANEGRSAQWAIVVRLNKALPTGANHRSRGDLRLDHEPSDSGASRVGSRVGRACYLANYSSENDKQGAPQLVSPHNGQRVTVTLYFNKRKTKDTRLHAKRRSKLADVNTREGVQEYLQQLGCLQ